MEREAYLLMKQVDESQYNRWTPQTNTCYGKEYESFIEGFFSQFHDSLFYALVIQFFMVALMYNSMGKGIYWKVLFYASFAGLLGTLCENGTMAYICRKSEKEKVDNHTEESSMHFVLLLVDEVFWILSEYAIPYLNLIKMKAFARGKTALVVKYSIYLLLVPFVIVRFLIGYTRMTKGYLNNSDIRQYHGYAFGVMAIADLLCTFAILYFVRKNNILANAESSINHYVKHSSYTILVCVDVVSCILSFLNIFANYLPENKVLNSIIIPFHCLKSSFVLILAIDALLFKYGAHVNSLTESTSGNCTKSLPNGYNYNRKSSFSGKPGKPGYGPSYAIEMPTINDMKIKTEVASDQNTASPNINNSYGKSSPATPSFGKNSPAPNYAKAGSPIPGYAKSSSGKTRPSSTHTRKYSASSRKSSVSNLAYAYNSYEQLEDYPPPPVPKPGNAAYSNKSIVKNYTNAKTKSTLFDAPNEINNKYAAQNFGYFTNQTKNY